MSELRDVIAAVLDENRLRSPRVQANAVLEVIDGRKRPLAVASCARCAEWDAALADRTIAVQAVDAAEASGRLRPFALRLLSELLDCRGARGITKAGVT